jgi:hypothetical protein
MHSTRAMNITEPQGPFYSNWGPRNDLILKEDNAATLGVYPNPECEGGRIGTAAPFAFTPQRKSPVEWFYLEVHGVRLEGIWVCRKRQFIHLVDAFEDE